jgi:hypothetical protein
MSWTLPSTASDFLTITSKADLNEAACAAIRKWVAAGGTLWIDVAGGDQAAALQLESLLPRLSGEKNNLATLNDARVLAGTGLTGGYDVRRLTRRKIRRRARQGNRSSSRQSTIVPAIYVAKADVTCGLAGLNHWGIAGYEPATARKLVTNTILAMLAGPVAKSPTSRATTTATTQPNRPRRLHIHDRIEQDNLCLYTRRNLDRERRRARE